MLIIAEAFRRGALRGVPSSAFLADAVVGSLTAASPLFRMTRSIEGPEIGVFRLGFGVPGSEVWGAIENAACFFTGGVSGGRMNGDRDVAGICGGEGEFEGAFEADGDGVVAGRIRLDAEDLAASAEQDSRVGRVRDSNGDFDRGAFGDQGVTRQENAAEADVLGSRPHFLARHFDQDGQVQWVAGLSSFWTGLGIELGEGHRVSPFSFLMAENTTMPTFAGDHLGAAGGERMGRPARVCGGNELLN